VEDAGCRIKDARRLRIEDRRLKIENKGYRLGL
jgi:hypothetical protein